jgi:hypothetical protein
MGMLLTMILLVGVVVLAFTGGVWATYRLLDGDSQYDVLDWWRRRRNDVFPFSGALIYRVRWWWRHKVRGKPVPTPYDGPMPNFISSIFALSPLDVPFLSMIGKEDKTLTAGDHDPEFYAWRKQQFERDPDDDTQSYRISDRIFTSDPEPSIDKDAIVAGPGLLERLRELNKRMNDDLT